MGRCICEGLGGWANGDAACGVDRGNAARMRSAYGSWNSDWLNSTCNCRSMGPWIGVSAAGAKVAVEENWSKPRAEGRWMVSVRRVLR